ncbi:S1 family peptidase [Alteromonas sp. BMJM2]|uniref:S1 family peptidase n=1 Tax=Alteromonas sp. BMJM2 TaxID=2954241 RepID=UPI0022B431B4|nr:serine protease [Alteromonas sp. BMJM2]
MKQLVTFILCIAFIFASSTACAHRETETPFYKVVEKVSESTVAIALNSPLKHSTPKILGTGFAVGNGNYVVTNYHVVSSVLDPTIVEDYVVLKGKGTKLNMIKGSVVHIDVQHDLALIALEGRLKPLELDDSELLPAGKEIAFTGFPIGAVLGLYPATHRGFISALTPDAIPAQNADQLTAEMMKRLASTSVIYQLDATAYPGNSGSPMYDVKSGKVIGIINKVIVKDAKESALTAPSGISYAIPVAFIEKLLSRVSDR